MDNSDRVDAHNKMDEKDEEERHLVQLQEEEQALEEQAKKLEEHLRQHQEQQEVQAIEKRQEQLEQAIKKEQARLFNAEKQLEQLEQFEGESELFERELGELGRRQAINEENERARVEEAITLEKAKLESEFEEAIEHYHAEDQRAQREAMRVYGQLHKIRAKIQALKGQKETEKQ